MSRRVLLGLAAVLAVAALIILWPRAAPLSEPVPRALPAAPGPPRPPPPPPLPERTPVAALDAGAPTGLLTITLERNGQPEIGPRLTLRDAQGTEASRTTDVMGLATFELPLGPWLVTAPPEVAGETVEVTREPRRVTLTLPPLLRVEGVVLGEDGAPRPGVPVTASLHWFTPTDAGEEREVARTDATGHFAFTTLEQSMDLVAVEGEARAVKRISAPVSGVQLRLETMTWLSVVPPPATPVTLSLVGRAATSIHELSGPTALRVPAGELEARALAVIGGKLQSARHRIVAPAGQTTELQLEFAPAPPVSGVVQDASGALLKGVMVALKLAPSNPGMPPRAQETTQTDERGHFELVPRLIRGGDPVYELHLMPPWRERRAVLVRLGEAPLVIEAEPAP